jgi:hypothetical protein
MTVLRLPAWYDITLIVLFNVGRWTEKEAF